MYGGIRGRTFLESFIVLCTFLTSLRAFLMRGNLACLGSSHRSRLLPPSLNVLSRQTVMTQVYGGLSVYNRY